jgi:hypothetical protein
VTAGTHEVAIYTNVVKTLDVFSNDNRYSDICDFEKNKVADDVNLAPTIAYFDVNRPMHNRH